MTCVILRRLRLGFLHVFVYLHLGECLSLLLGLLSQSVGDGRIALGHLVQAQTLQFRIRSYQIQARMFGAFFFHEHTLHGGCSLTQMSAKHRRWGCSKGFLFLDRTTFICFLKFLAMPCMTRAYRDNYATVTW